MVQTIPPLFPHTGDLHLPAKTILNASTPMCVSEAVKTPLWGYVRKDIQEFCAQTV